MAPGNRAVLSFISEPVEALTGHPAASFVANSLLWESLIHPLDQSQAAHSDPLLLRDGQPLSRRYRIRNHLTHQWIQLEERAQKIDGADGGTDLICGVVLPSEVKPEVLQKGENNFTDLIESVEGIVWEVDPKTFRYTYVSKQAERLLGYPLGRWMEEPTFWQDHLHPEDAAVAIEECLRETREMRNHELEYRMIAADGRIVWIRDYVTVVVADDAPVLLRGIMVDTTPAKESAETLQRANEALVDAGRIAKVGLWELNLNPTEKIWWSDLTYQIHEVEQGRPITPVQALEYYIPEHRELVRDAIRNALEGDEPWDMTLQIETAKKRRIWVRSIGHTIWHQGKAVKTRGIFQDIDTIKRAEEKLHESEERWQFALEGSGDGVWDWTPPTNTLFLSKQLKSILGDEQSPVSGAFKDLRARIHQEDFALAEQSFREHLDQATTAYSSEHRLLCNDGSYKWVFERAIVLSRTEDGKPSRVIGTLMDITSKRATEEQLRQSQKMDAVGQLAGGVAHDFNNILAIILMHAELSLASQGLPCDASEALLEIRRAAQRAADLTKQLLLFSRRQSAQPRICDLNDQVANLIKMLRRVIGEDIAIQIRISPSPLTARFDPGMIDQVLLNLVVNAGNAIICNGRILVETEEATVLPDQARLNPGAKPGRYAILRVQDNGIGIAPDHLQRIFEPFFTTREPGKGVGLGLTAVFGIVKQHSGFIQVRSKVCEGTTVEVFLPMTDIPAEESTVSEDIGDLYLPGQTILVVEDEPSLRKATHRILTKQGYRVLEASNGPEALLLWEKHSEDVDLLLTDIVMPEGLSGLQLAEQLQKAKPSLRVIYSSGYSPDTADEDGIWPADRVLLQKPYSPASLLTTIGRTLATA